MKLVHLPDGTTVRASALAERRVVDGWRDYGLYLEPAWNPEWPAHVLAWPDYGLPASSEDGYQHICAAFERARGGVGVEIGCRGGLGRTGTVLACFVVLCSALDPPAAVAWVRNNYDCRAVETPEQEAWVAWFAARLKEDRQRE